MCQHFPHDAAGTELRSICRCHQEWNPSSGERLQSLLELCKEQLPTPTQDSAPRDLDVRGQQSAVQELAARQQHIWAGFLGLFKNAFIWTWNSFNSPADQRDGRKYYRQECPLQMLQLSGFLFSSLEMKMQQFRKRSFHKVVMGPFNLVQTSCHAYMKD